MEQCDIFPLLFTKSAAVFFRIYKFVPKESCVNLLLSDTTRWPSWRSNFESTCILYKMRKSELMFNMQIKRNLYHALLHRLLHAHEFFHELLMSFTSHIKAPEFAFYHIKTLGCGSPFKYRTMVCFNKLLFI